MCERARERSATDIDLVGAQRAEVVAAVVVWLELEERLVVRVRVHVGVRVRRVRRVRCVRRMVRRVLAQRGARRRRLRLRRQHRLRVRHLLHLLEELRLSLDSGMYILLINNRFH